MRKIFQTKKFRKLKTKENGYFMDKACKGSYFVCFRNGTYQEAYSGDDLIQMLEKDHLKPIRYVFSAADRICVDREIKIIKEIPNEEETK